MDTDDCDETTRDKYISGTLFNGYALKEYVVPIFTTPDLEHVLFECGIIDKIFKPKEKLLVIKKYLTYQRCHILKQERMN